MTQVQHVEDFVVLGIISVLVAFFAWIYFRDRQTKSAWWLAGWIAIFFHFLGFAIVHGMVPGGHLLGTFVNRLTLVIAGTFFLLSVSDEVTRNWRNAASTIYISLSALVYVIAETLYLRNLWLYVAILLTSSIIAVVESFRIYGRRSFFWTCIWIGLAPYLVFAIRRATEGDTRHGMDFYLFSLYVVTGLLFLRHFRRPTPGVVFTSIAFLAWGCVFPLANYLQHSRIGVYSEFWDLPKYSVAFGMLLTLFENQAEAARLAARQFQQLFESNLAAVYVATFDGKLLDCNSAFLNMYGFASKLEAAAEFPNSQCLDPAERVAFLEALKRDGQVLNHECRHHRRDGSAFWILERATVVTHSGGHRVIEGTAIDITERKQAEIALKQSEERFATVFRQSPVGCAILTLDGYFISVNEHLLRMIGRAGEDVIGRNSVELGFFRTTEERHNFFDRLRSHRSVANMDVTFKDAAGNLHEGLYFASIVWIGDKECIFGMLLDQTEQRNLERNFLQAQKMEALGRLAGGVAHDFNNLLGVIGGYAELLETRLGTDDNYRRYCGKILDTTERAGALTRQLLTFSRKEIIRPRPLRPDHAIRELHGILPRLIGEDIELVLDLRSMGTLVMDKTHFEQIILNLVVNARDAMPSGGQIYITTEDISKPLLCSDGTLRVADSVAIHISDTGVGMDAETLAHAFEPFYTTKAVGQGTGLGLATVYGIVQQSQGDISISSQPGQGTRVSILVPAVTEVEPAAPVQVHGPVQKGAGTILIVEDEAELRNNNAEFLSSIGYSVVCAASGMEGLEIARKTDKIDLVITDVVMPRMNGREFTDRLLELRPEIKVLFVSGYADDVILQTGVSMQDTPFLQKPFSLRQLGTVVNELLAVANPS